MGGDRFPVAVRLKYRLEVSDDNLSDISHQVCRRHGKICSIPRRQTRAQLRFQSPEWSEFDTGATTLALHVASAANPAGTCQLGLGVSDIQQFYAKASSQGVQFTSPPTELHGQRIAKLRDIDGAECSVSGP